jgi:shikimate dehydrogenase
MTTLEQHADRYAVVGNPIEHSRSPAIHALFAQQTGQTVDYTRLLAPMDGFANTVRQWVQAQGAKGCNVTVPFKFEALEMAAQRTPRATLAQAANTLGFPTADPTTWWADNTDGAGLVRDITVNANTRIQGARVLLGGAGGASAGVLGPLIEQCPASICVVNRTLAKAEELVMNHADWARQHGVQLSAQSLDELNNGPIVAPFDIIVNGTAASLSGSFLSLPAQCLRAGTLVVDMMYGPKAEPFLQWAQSLGAVPRDGLGMLVEQAAEAFFLWRGVRPDTAPVLQALRQTL